MTQVSSALLPNGEQSFVDPNGQPYGGGSVGMYVPGTLTAKVTYSDQAQATPNSNPLTLDSAGRCVMWGSGSYRQILKDQFGNTIWDKITALGYDAIPTFQTQALAQAGTVAAGVNLLNVQGYTAVGDGGGGNYVRGSFTPGYPGTLVLADSSTWQYVPDSRGVNAKAFGCVANGTFNASTNGFTGTDNSAALQAAVDFGTYFCLRPVYLPAGLYLIDSALQIGYGAGSFNSTEFSGDGGRYRAGSQFSGTALLCNFSNQPGMNIQGARRTRVSGIALIGQNYSYVANNNLGDSAATPSVDDTVLANWLASGLDSNANSQFAPYAALVIDGYAGVQPSPAYPSVSYPGFLGAQSQYGKNFSSEVKFTDVYWAGFVGGLAIQPCNADGNGDFISLEDCAGEYCAWMVSAGNTQGRSFGISGNSYFSNFHTGFVDTQNGKQEGVFGGQISNAGFDRNIQLVNCTAGAFAGPMLFSGCYGESMWRLGNWGSPENADQPLVFESCDWNFTNQNETRGFPTTMMQGGVPACVKFIGGSLTSFTSVALFSGQISGFSFDGMLVRPAGDSSGRPSAYEQAASNLLADGLMFQTTTVGLNRPGVFNVKMNNRYNLDDGTTTQGETVGSVCRTQHAYPVCAWSSVGLPTNEMGYFPTLPPIWDVASKSGFSSVSLSGTTLTLVFNSLTDAQAYYSGYLPGDVLIDDNSLSVFFIRSRSSVTVLAELQNNYKVVSTVVTLFNSFSTTAGNFYSGNSRFYLPPQFAQGDLSDSSTTVANVGNAAGSGGFMSDVLVGDYLYNNTHLQSWITPANGKIGTVTPGNPGSLVVTGNPNVSLLGQALGWFIRQPPGNV